MQARGRRVPRPFRVVCERAGILSLSHHIHDLAGTIGRAIVDRDHFVVVVVESKQTTVSDCSMVSSSLRAGTMMETRGSPLGVTGLRSHSWPGNIGDARHAKSGIHNAGEPASARIVPAIQVSISVYVGADHSSPAASEPRRKAPGGEFRTSPRTNASEATRSLQGNCSFPSTQPPARISFHRTVWQKRCPSR